MSSLLSPQHQFETKENKATETTTRKIHHGQGPYEKSEINDIFRPITLSQATEEIVFLFPGLDEMSSVLSANNIHDKFSPF